MTGCHARTEPMGAVFRMLLPSAASHGTCQPGQVHAKMMTRTSAHVILEVRMVWAKPIYLRGRGPPWKRQGFIFVVKVSAKFAFMPCQTPQIFERPLPLPVPGKEQRGTRAAEGTLRWFCVAYFAARNTGASTQIRT